MIIEKDKPLPDHTHLDYYECYAKLVLEGLFPDRYVKLEILDKPDLQGRDFGVEVTSADSQEKREALKNWLYANACSDEEKRKRYIKRMAQLGVTYTGGIQAWPGSVPSFESTRKVVLEKVQKVKKGYYNAFRNLQLFVFTDMWYTDSVITEAKQYLFSQAVGVYFETIYILAESQDLHVFETAEKVYHNYKIDATKQYELAERARQMVEDAENNQALLF